MLWLPSNKKSPSGFGVVWLVLSAPLILGAGCQSVSCPVLPARITPLALEAPVANIVIPTQSEEVILASCPKTQELLMISPQTLAQLNQVKLDGQANQLVLDEARQTVYCLHASENALTPVRWLSRKAGKKVNTGSISLANGSMRPQTDELWICDGVSSVWVLIVPEWKLKKKIELGRFPERVVFTPGGHKAYITLKGENAVAEIDADQMEKIKNIKVGIYPRNLAWVDKTLCVSNFGSKDVSLVDTDSGEERTRIKVFKKPNKLAVQGNLLWVACEGSFKIVAIDVPQAKLAGMVKCGFYPNAIRVLQDGRIVVSALQSKKMIFVSLPAPKSTE